MTSPASFGVPLRRTWPVPPPAWTHAPQFVDTTGRCDRTTEHASNTNSQTNRPVHCQGVVEHSNVPSRSSVQPLGICLRGHLAWPYTSGARCCRVERRGKCTVDFVPRGRCPTCPGRTDPKNLKRARCKPSPELPFTMWTPFHLICQVFLFSRQHTNVSFALLSLLPSVVKNGNSTETQLQPLHVAASGGNLCAPHTNTKSKPDLLRPEGPLCLPTFIPEFADWRALSPLLSLSRPTHSHPQQPP